MPDTLTDVEQLARWLHETFNRLCPEGNLKPWSQLPAGRDTAYLRVAGELLANPPTMLRRQVMAMETADA